MSFDLLLKVTSVVNLKKKDCEVSKRVPISMIIEWFIASWWQRKFGPISKTFLIVIHLKN